MTLNFSIAGVDPDLFEKNQWNIVPLWQEEQKKGYIKKDDFAVITAGVPVGISGATNLVRVEKCV